MKTFITGMILLTTSIDVSKDPSNSARYHLRAFVDTNDIQIVMDEFDARARQICRPYELISEIFGPFEPGNFGKAYYSWEIECL